MDLTQLRYFQVIAECGSISAAARQLKVSQPGLTGALQNLEEELETTLFHRDRRGVTLTDTGRLLLEHASEIFRQLEQAEQEIRGLQREEAGRFVIGCHESLGAYFLPRFMRRLLQDAPRIEVAIWNGTSQEVRDAVVSRAVHFGLVVNPVPHPDLVLVELFHDAVELFVASSEPETPDLAAAEARLRKGPLIYAARVGQCQELVAELESADRLPPRHLTCGDLELVKSLALAGTGVALLPRRVAAYEQEGRLRRLHPELPSIPDTIHLLYRGDTHRTRAAMRLKDALVAYGREIDAERP